MLDPTFHITTPRLYLSYLDPSNDAHMAYMVRLKNSPNILAMASQTGAAMAPPPRTISEARAALTSASAASRLASNGTGRYIVSLRPPKHLSFSSHHHHEYIGTVSMQLQRHAHAAGPQIPDLGFALLEQYCGRGFAREACEALMQHFTATRGWVRFAGFTHPENVSSQKLFHRLGFESRGTVVVAGVLAEAVPMAVWVKGVDAGVALGELGICAGVTEGGAGGLQ